MVIKINTTKAGIPVEIGELKFTFDTSDDALTRLAETGETFMDDLSKIKGNDLEATKEALRRGFDFLLGPSSFDQIYKQTPSAIQCIKILEQLYISLTVELEAAGNKYTQQEKAEHYLKQKQKQKKQKKSKK